MPLLPLFLPVMECPSMETKTVLCNFGILLRNFSLTWEVKTMIPIASIAMFLIVGALFGRALCGWVCPLGFVQDLISRFLSALKIDQKEFSEKTHYMLTSVKYIVLFASLVPVISVGITYWVSRVWGRKYAFSLGLCGKAPYCVICPVPVMFVTVPSLLTSFVGGTSIPQMPFTFYIGLFFMLFFLASAVIWKRSWCMYMCPVGALMSLFNKYSLLNIRKDPHKCTAFCRGHKRECVDTCPMGIKVSRNEIPSGSQECILCYSCSDSCSNKAIKIKVG